MSTTDTDDSAVYYGKKSLRIVWGDRQPNFYKTKSKGGTALIEFACLGAYDDDPPWLSIEAEEKGDSGYTKNVLLELTLDHMIKLRDLLNRNIPEEKFK